MPRILVTRQEAADRLGYTVRSLTTVMLRYPNRWPAPVAVRIVGRANLYDLADLIAVAGGEDAPLSRKAATVSDPDGLITCLECGQRMRSLARHLQARHGIDAAEYRARHRLPRTAALQADQTRRSRARSARETLSGRLEALAPYQTREHLAEMQRRSVAGVRASYTLPVAEEHRQSGRERAVAAMSMARREKLERQARCAGWESLAAAIEATRHLSCAEAARRIGIGSSTVHRHRRAARGETL